MYAVHTVFRPGHPRWAIAASAALLTAALALAALLTHSKTRALAVPLEPESELFPDTRVEARLPAGWSRIEGDTDLFPGCVAALKPEDRVGELLVLFRDVPRPFVVPTADGVDLLRQMLSRFESGLEAVAEPSRVGPLPAVAGVFRATAGRGEGPPSHYLARMAVAPDGQILGLIYHVPRPPRPQDHQLVEEVSRHLSLQDLGVAEDAAAVMAEAGIVFEPPAEARFFVQVGSPGIAPTRLRLSAGLESSCWYLELARAPLVRSRTVEELVTDYALSVLRAAELPTALEASDAGDRKLWRASLAGAVDLPTVAFVGGVEVDAQTALIMRVRYEAGAEALVQGMCAAIAAKAEVSSFEESLDSAAAMERARDLLGELAEETLTTLWAARVRHPERYTMYAPGLALFEEATTYSSRASEGYRWWEVGVTSGPVTRRDRRTEPHFQEQYSLRDDLAGHAYVYKSGAASRVEAAYEEIRLPGELEIAREIRPKGGEPHRWRTRLDDVYACEPVLLAAAARMAQQTPGRPALFSTTGAFIPHLSYCLLTPLGLQPLPQPEADELAWAVRVDQDYGAAPVTVYFDDAGVLQATDLDHGLWMERKAK